MNGSSNANDSFADLVNFSNADGASKLDRLPLADRQKYLQTEQARRSQLSYSSAAYTDASAWDALESYKKPATREPQRAETPKFPVTGMAFTETDDDPFDLKNTGPSKTIHRAPSDEDDVLGALARPVEQTAVSAAVPSPDRVEATRSKQAAESDHPGTSAVSSLVDMGFSAEDAQRALSKTETGLDVQGAVSFLLNEAHGRTGSHVPSRGQSPFQGSAVPPQRRTPTPGNNNPSATATDIGQNILRNANLLWNTGRKRVAKALEEFNREEDQPRWMREATHEGKTASLDDGITEEARRLEIKSQPATARTEPRPPSRESLRGNFYEHEQQVYTSPARRKKADPRSKPGSANEHAGNDAKQDTFSFASRTTPPIRSTPPPSIQSRSPLIRSTVPIPDHALSKVTALRQRGSTSFQHGDYSSALISFSECISLLPAQHPILIVLYNNRAQCNLKLGDARAALLDCDAALSMIGDRRGRDEAIKLDAQIKPMKEHWSKAVFRRAEALEQLERWPEALQAWNQLVEEGAGVRAVEGRRRAQQLVQPLPKKPATLQRPAKPAPPRSARPSGSARAAVDRLRAANLAAEANEAQKLALYDSVDARIAAWKAGREKNIRALLASLDAVLWPAAGWNKVGMHQLVTDARVKVVYMKAIAKVHPDKVSTSASVEEKMIAGAVFSILNEAWDAFRQ